MQPDRLHLHSLFKSRITRKWFRQASPVTQNAAVSPLAWALACLPVLLGVALREHPAAAYVGMALFVAVYTALYRRLVLFGWR